MALLNNCVLYIFLIVNVYYLQCVKGINEGPLRASVNQMILKFTPNNNRSFRTDYYYAEGDKVDVFISVNTGTVSAFYHTADGDYKHIHGYFMAGLGVKATLLSRHDKSILLCNHLIQNMLMLYEITFVMKNDFQEEAISITANNFKFRTQPWQHYSGNTDMTIDYEYTINKNINIIFERNVKTTSEIEITLAEDLKNKVTMIKNDTSITLKFYIQSPLGTSIKCTAKYYHSEVIASANLTFHNTWRNDPDQLKLTGLNETKVIAALYALPDITQIFYEFDDEDLKRALSLSCSLERNTQNTIITFNGTVPKHTYGNRTIVELTSTSNGSTIECRTNEGKQITVFLSMRKNDLPIIYPSEPPITLLTTPKPGTNQGINLPSKSNTNRPSNYPYNPTADLPFQPATNEHITYPLKPGITEYIIDPAQFTTPSIATVYDKQAHDPPGDSWRLIVGVCAFIIILIICAIVVFCRIKKRKEGLNTNGGYVNLQRQSSIEEIPSDKTDASTNVNLAFQHDKVKYSIPRITDDADAKYFPKNQGLPDTTEHESIGDTYSVVLPKTKSDAIPISGTYAEVMPKGHRLSKTSNLTNIGDMYTELSPPDHRTSNDTVANFYSEPTPKSLRISTTFPTNTCSDFKNQRIPKTYSEESYAIPLSKDQRTPKNREADVYTEVLPKDQRKLNITSDTYAEHMPAELTALGNIYGKVIPKNQRVSNTAVDTYAEPIPKDKRTSKTNSKDIYTEPMLKNHERSNIAKANLNDKYKDQAMSYAYDTYSEPIQKNVRVENTLKVKDSGQRQKRLKADYVDTNTILDRGTEKEKHIHFKEIDDPNYNEVRVGYVNGNPEANDDDIRQLSNVDSKDYYNVFDGNKFVNSNKGEYVEPVYSDAEML